jgi:hypothetical protein
MLRPEMRLLPTYLPSPFGTLSAKSKVLIVFAPPCLVDGGVYRTDLYHLQLHTLANTPHKYVRRNTGFDSMEF